MACKNCGHNVEDDSKYCPQCGQAIHGCTIEDFLDANFRIFAVIGVFGAMALYLASFAEKNENTFLLQAGSLLSLTIVVLLSVNLVFRVSPYLKNCAASEKAMEESYRSWLKLSWNIIQIQVFRAVFLLIIACIALYLLIYSNMNSALLNSLGALIMLLIMITFIYMPAINIMKTKERYGIAFIIIILMSVGLLVLYLWCILPDSSKVFYLSPMPVVSILTIYASFNAYTERKRESSSVTSSLAT
jgi:hypothetical protein